MIEENDIQALLKRIEGSNSFGSSATYGRLLQFLVACTQENNIPKEHALAEHIFGKNAEGADTSKIRVYVYHLRKKLQLYFENEGKDDPYTLSIPKGGYKVQFKKNTADSLWSVLSPNAKIAIWGILGLLLCSIAVNALLVYKNNSTPQHLMSKSPIWQDFFKNDKPVLVIIGDLFIFSEENHITGKLVNFRLPEINSKAEFETYKNLEENDERILAEMTYPHLVKSSAEWVSQLTKIFHPTKDFNIRVRTRVDAKDVHDYNIVFVGMQKTAGILNSYFDSSVFDYDSKETNEYRLKSPNGMLSYQPEGDPNNKHSDYGFIAKYPGPNNNTIFMFSGLWDSATSESLRNFASPNKISVMEKCMEAELGHIPEYFEMLIGVNGVDRIGFETKVLHLNELSNN
ncbi:MAG: hypothetical protein COA50_07860 [Flavobacteriaceae bacterium]|nr:MAG: hypothetical protein COA50_07860 [Flavobacteriaceae bacterium]